MTDNTQPRDWSEIINEITRLAINMPNYRFPLPPHESTLDFFRYGVLAILQEFDAQNPRINEHSQCCHGCQADIDMLIEVIVKSYREGDWGELADHVEINYRKQWAKYAKGETTLTEEPKAWPELIIGEQYTILPNEGVATLIAFRDDDHEVVMRCEEEGYFLCKKSELIERYTPAPAEQAEGGWRPIDSCPKNGEQFLVTDGEFIIMAEHPNDEIIAHDITSCGVGFITHWMPLGELPKPPAREGDGA